METEKNVSRRAFLRGHFLTSLQSEQQKIREQQQGCQVIRPPWVDLSKFAENCTACQACIHACEPQILVQGLGGLPEVDFSKGQHECTFCQACVKACEADVFRAVSERPWQHKVAISSHCLVQQRVECRSCQDICPERAIKFHRQLGSVSQPSIQRELCSGCGACLSICPVGAVKIERENAVNSL